MLFEMLMAFNEESLARRAMIQNRTKPKEIALKITLGDTGFLRTYVQATELLDNDTNIITSDTRLQKPRSAAV